MDQAHLHLVLNHFPILGTLFACILLFIGALKNNRTIQKVGLMTMFIVTIITIPAFLTGEAAEHATEHIAGSSHEMLEEHEELGEFAFLNILVIGAVAGLLFFFVHRNKHQDFRRLVWGMFGLTAYVFVLMAVVGNHGGKIRRPELRGEVVQNQHHDNGHDHSSHEESEESYDDD